MNIYAQIQNGIVIGISQLSGQVIQENLINITDLTEKPTLGSLYDKKTGVFSPPKVEDVVPFESLEEKVSRLEQMVTDGNIEQYDVLASIYEILLTKGE